MKTNEVVAGRKLKKGEPKDGETVSNGRHTLREAYAGKRELRQFDREERRIARSQRTPEQQLDVLDEHLGRDVGARKERARLDLQIFDQMGTSGQEQFPVSRETLVENLEIAKMEARGYRIMRRLGLSERELPKFGCTHIGAQAV